MSRAPVATTADGVQRWLFVVITVILNANKYLVDKE